MSYFNEFLEYTEKHDLEQEECDLLESWVRNNHSVYDNPDDFLDDYGKPVSFIKWYRILKDKTHPEHERLLKHSWEFFCAKKE